MFDRSCDVSEVRVWGIPRDEELTRPMDAEEGGEGVEAVFASSFKKSNEVRGRRPEMEALTHGPKPRGPRWNLCEGSLGSMGPGKQFLSALVCHNHSRSLEASHT